MVNVIRAEDGRQRRLVFAKVNSFPHLDPLLPSSPPGSRTPPWKEVRPLSTGPFSPSLPPLLAHTTASSRPHPHRHSIHPITQHPTAASTTLLILTRRTVSPTPDHPPAASSGCEATHCLHAPPPPPPRVRPAPGFDEEEGVIEFECDGGEERVLDEDGLGAGAGATIWIRTGSGGGKG
ncbi:hypothetical protein JCM5296_004080 [Sporobolomyces johnsonii]